MAMLMAGSLLLAGLTGCGGANAKGGGAAASADDLEIEVLWRI